MIAFVCSGHVHDCTYCLSHVCDLKSTPKGPARSAQSPSIGETLMKSVMRHQFSQVPKVEIQRSSFDRSHGYKTTFNGGFLVPFFVDEALPGDTANLRCTTFARMATPLHPIMDNLYCDVFFSLCLIGLCGPIL